MDKDKPVLVTGCAGFIASRTCQLLLEQGHTVVGIDNLNNYYDVTLKNHRLAWLKDHPTFQFMKADIESADIVDELFAQHRFSAVLNLAARAGVRYSMENPQVYMTTNAMGTLHLLEAMKKYGCQKMVLASTSSLYAGQEMPFVEDLPVNTPISPYAASKKSAEAMAYAYHHLYGLDISVLRYFTVYGPADRPDMAIHRFIQWIDRGQPITVFGDGQQARDFTYVDDIARGTLLAMKPLGYEIVNLGGGRQPVELNSIIERIEKLLGRKAEIDRRPTFKADMKFTWADISKAARLLQWEPVTSIDEGLGKCVKWYRQNAPWSATIDLNSPSGRS